MAFFRKTVLFFFIALALSVPDAAVKADNDAAMLERCVAALENSSYVYGSLLRKTIDRLSQDEKAAFATYLRMLAQDATQGKNHIVDIDDPKEKERLLRQVLNAKNPSELIEAFFRNRHEMARLGDGSDSEDFATPLRALSQRLKPGSGEQAPKPKGLPETPEQPMPVLNSATSGLESMQPEPSQQQTVSVRPREVSQDEAAVREVLQEEGFSVLISMLFDRDGVRSIEHRMIALLIFRLESYLSGGRHGDIGTLSAYPERFLPSVRLAQVFRDAEHAIRAYFQAEAKITFLTSLSTTTLKARPDLSDLIAEQRVVLAGARAKLASNMTIYLGVKAYLEETITNDTCGLRCRVNALQALSLLGSFDLISEATKTSTEAFPNALETAIHDAILDGDNALKSALDNFDRDFVAYRYFGSAATYNILKRDPELQSMVHRASRKRSWTYGAASFVNSNAFRKLALLMPKKYQLDNIPFIQEFTGSFAEESRDQQEKLMSVGTLLILARSNIDMYSKLSELESLYAIHPPALVTLQRPGPCRMLYLQVLDATAKDENLKKRFQPLLDGITAAASDRDAKRPLDLATEPSIVGKVFTGTMHAVTIAAMIGGTFYPQTTARVAAWGSTAVYNHFMSTTHLGELKQDLDQVLNANPALRQQLQGALEGEK